MTQALADVGENLNDVDQVATILGSLPSKYSPFVAA